MIQLLTSWTINKILDIFVKKKLHAFYISKPTVNLEINKQEYIKIKDLFNYHNDRIALYLIK